MMHDFEMRPGTRRPKILVQTAGHVSGAAYFYQKDDIVNPPWDPQQVQIPNIPKCKAMIESTFLVTL